LQVHPDFFFFNPESSDSSSYLARSCIKVIPNESSSSSSLSS
jgi:hypothetical protein